MGAGPDGSRAPNGVDFWWDAFPGSRGNCWYRNTGPDPITSSPRSLPSCADGSKPASSIATGDLVNEAELLSCFVAFTSASYQPGVCPWFTTPPEPGSRSTSRARVASMSETTAAVRVLDDFCRVATTDNSACRAYAPLLRAAGVRLDPELAALQAASPRSHTPAGVLVAAVPGSRKLLSLFTCDDWRHASAITRTAVLRRLAAFTSGHVVARGVDGWGTALTAQQGATFLDRRCDSGLPGSLALYKMYGYAAGFIGGIG